MINLLKPHTWSKFYRSSSNDSSKLLHVTYKRQLLLSQLTIISLLVTTAHLVLDAIMGPPVTVIMDLIIIVILLVGYLANENGHETFAKVSVTVFMNVIIFIYANIIPKENGIFFLFFPLISLYFVIFDYKDHFKRYVLLAITVGSFLLLELFDYKLIAIDNPVEQPDLFSYVLNFISAVSILYFSYNFLVKSNFKAEQQMVRQSEKILRQNRDLEKTNRELDLFVYRSSHDIKAPLASIQGLINLLNMEEVSENQKEYISRIEDRVKKLETFIAEITKYSRNVRLDLQPEPVDISSLIQEVINSHRYYKRADVIKTIVNDLIEKPVYSDKSRLLTVLNNLYSNAIKYHDPFQRDPSIWIDCRLVKDTVQIEITDNGPGIEPQIKDKIFDMFFRGNEASDGSGLGLFIVKEVLEKLNGTITLKPNYPKGSVFCITFPATKPDLE